MRPARIRSPDTVPRIEPRANYILHRHTHGARQVMLTMHAGAIQHATCAAHRSIALQGFSAARVQDVPRSSAARSTPIGRHAKGREGVAPTARLGRVQPATRIASRRASAHALVHTSQRAWRRLV